jgi:hypothetical protein
MTRHLSRRWAVLTTQTPPCKFEPPRCYGRGVHGGDVRCWPEAARKGWAERVRSASVRQTSTRSAIASASSTYTEGVNRNLDLGVPQQKLHGSQIAGDILNKGDLLFGLNLGVALLIPDKVGQR